MITTDRFIIQPLTTEQVSLYILPNEVLEKALYLVERPRFIPPQVVEAITERVLPRLHDTTKNYLYSTFWTVIDKKTNTMLADICFKGEPDDKGEIEIGYGTHAEFQGQNVMTEAVGGILEWAFAQPNVKAVRAETDIENTASQRILQKNNFVLSHETADSRFWIKQLYNQP
jgi:[ribosomal protein S5]-alanine N-acetyltransferase